MVAIKDIRLRVGEASPSDIRLWAQLTFPVNIVSVISVQMARVDVNAILPTFSVSVVAQKDQPTILLPSRQIAVFLPPVGGV